MATVQCVRCGAYEKDENLGWILSNAPPIYMVDCIQLSPTPMPRICYACAIKLDKPVIPAETWTANHG